MRGAAAVAGAAWLTPVVTVVSMSSASAASGPPPSNGAGSSGDPGAAASASGGTAASALAFTGSNANEAAIIGVATVATGAAAIVAARRLRKTEPGTVPPAGRHRGDADPT